MLYIAIGIIGVVRPFLAELGVTDAQHRLVPAMARKWKQINKFVEVLDHALSQTALKQADSVDVVDFGSGKGYLTFATHDHLRHTLGLPARVAGVELREDMVALCNAAAQRLAIASVNARYGGRFRLLQGIEANIDPTGHLDLTADEATIFDVVLAAPHSRLRKNDDQEWSGGEGRRHNFRASDGHDKLHEWTESVDSLPPRSLS